MLWLAPLERALLSFVVVLDVKENSLSTCLTLSGW